MRKFLVNICLLAIIITLCSCGTDKGVVPEEFIEFAVRDRFGDKEYVFDTKHNVNSSTHTDNVTVNVKVANKYYGVIYSYDIYSGNGVYRYNKSNDTWDLYDKFSWDRTKTELNASGFVQKFEGNSKGANYIVDITSVDFTNKKISGSFYVTKNETSLSGSRKNITLDTSGSFNIKEEYDGMIVELKDNGYRFRFVFSKFYGLTDVIVTSLF